MGGDSATDRAEGRAAAALLCEGAAAVGAGVVESVLQGCSPVAKRATESTAGDSVARLVNSGGDRLGVGVVHGSGGDVR